MAKLSKETKQRLQTVFQAGQFVIRWGFIPTVLYLGFARGGDPGMPEPNILRCAVCVCLFLVWPSDTGNVKLADVLHAVTSCLFFV
uniref:Mitochondrial import receptor subunit TOM7 homolog n=1 Tax=Oncorhynchus tshawytscha TaxID=74940 RepID=A0AAZ3S3U4_ONCTS